MVLWKRNAWELCSALLHHDDENQTSEERMRGKESDPYTGLSIGSTGNPAVLLYTRTNDHFVTSLVQEMLAGGICQ